MSKRLMAFAAGFLVSLSASAAELRPLELKDVLNLHRFVHHSTIEISADGRLVAYVVLRPASSPVADNVMYTATGAPQLYGDADVWVTDLETGAARNLTDGQGVNWGAAWSPDGRYLAFCSDRDGRAGVWLWDRRGDTLRRLGDAVLRARSLQWSPDGKRILVGVLPQGAPLMVGASSGDDALAREQRGATRGPTVRVFRSEGSASGGRRTQNLGVAVRAADLALISVTDGRVDRIVPAVTVTKTAFSPDGRHVAFSAMSGDNVEGTHIQRYALRVFSLENRKLQTLLPPGEIGRWGYDFSWSPDSRWLAYRMGHDSGEVYLASLDGQVRGAATGSHPPFTGIPAWDEDGSHLLLTSEDAVWSVAATDGRAVELARFPGSKVEMLVPLNSAGERLWLPDEGRSVIAVTSKGPDNAFHRVSLSGRPPRLLFEEHRNYSGLTRYMLVAGPDGRVVYAAEDAGRPEDLWITDKRLGGSRQLTHLNPDINRVKMGAMRLIHWTGREGNPYAGVLLLPSNYEPGRRYPLVTYVYPIDVTPDANRFGSNHLSNEYFNLQLFATRGYAVLYSGATLRPEDREPMKAVADAVLAGIDEVIAMGVADPDRLGVFGVSAGGYSTLALIVQSTRFKAAMVQAGPGNLLSLYGSLDDRGYSHGLAVDENTFQMPDHPWADRERYIRNSPWFHLDKVQTPLLLIQGMDDAAVIPAQSNEIFVGLRRLGRTIEYARYVGEGHGLISMENRLDAGTRLLEWFERYLKPAEAADISSRRSPSSPPRAE